MLDGDVKKFCPSCRYNKCLEVGMKPELVLKEDEISERFKYQRNFRKRSYLTHNFQPGFTLENSVLAEEPRPSSFTSHSDNQEDPIISSGSSPSVTFSFSQSQLSDYQRVSVIIKNPHLNSDDTDIPESDQIEKDIFDLPETRNENHADNLILHYTHKKFRKLLLSKQGYEQIDKLSDKSQYPLVTGLSDVHKNNCLIIEHINDLDNNFLQEMNQTFTKAFGAVNLGEAVMNSYIDFCKRKTNGDMDLSLDPSFYSNCNLQIMKKFLNFVSDFDFINLSYRKLYRILQTNLPTVKSLFYVFQYNNNSNVEEELKLGCGELDLRQWHECPNKPQGVGFSEMVTYINMEPTAKLGLIRCLIELWQPIFRNKTVFILTFLLGLLDMEEDDEVRQLRQTVLFIMQRYLKGKLYSDQDMKSVGFILGRLPYLTELVT